MGDFVITGDFVIMVDFRLRVTLEFSVTFEFWVTFELWATFKLRVGGGQKESPSPPVPAKPNILYSRGSFVDIVCWTVG